MARVLLLLVDRGPRFYARQPVKPSLERQRSRPVQHVLEYLEELFQFDHQLPVCLHQIVPEVFLASVYALSAYL